MTINEDTARIVARIEQSALERHLQNYIGQEIIDPIRFRLALNTNEHKPFGVSETILSIVRQLDSHGDMDPLAVPCMEELLMSLLLTTQSHNYMHQLLDNTGKPAKPYYVHKADQFIRENAVKPITIDDLVSVTGVSARSLYAGFHKSHNMSPMMYLKSIRLQRVHEQLKKSDPGISTVTDIAASWGFVHFGNFAADYKKKFGEKPSETFRKIH
jgi:AraC-like DNA-binding protein